MKSEKQQVAMEPWLKSTGNVEVMEEKRTPDGNASTVMEPLAEWRYLINVNNGLEGEGAVGAVIARCRNSEEAVLIAEALRRMGSDE